MHQFKINAKQAFKGQVWTWHQDYINWHLHDGMSEAKAMNVAIFLDAVQYVFTEMSLVPLCFVGLYLCVAILLICSTIVVIM